MENCKKGVTEERGLKIPSRIGHNFKGFILKAGWDDSYASLQVIKLSGSLTLDRIVTKYIVNARFLLLLNITWNNIIGSEMESPLIPIPLQAY